MLCETATDHVREHGSVLAMAEKRILIWIANRLPQRINSDHLTLLGLSGMVLAGLAYWTARWHDLALLVVVPALAINWFGDSLDGTLARVRRHQRPRYGFYVDHVIDVIGASCLLGGMALSSYMSPLVALVVLVAYLMVAAEVYLATHACGVFRLSFLWVGATELRIILAIGAVYLLNEPHVRLGSGTYLLLDVAGIVAAVALFLILIASTVRNTRWLYKSEPLP